MKKKNKQKLRELEARLIEWAREDYVAGEKTRVGIEKGKIVLTIDTNE